MTSIFSYLLFQFLLVLLCLQGAASTFDQTNLDLGNEEFVLDAKTARKVSTLLKSSAERAKKNAPVIINQDSELFKKYQQQRLPRRAAEQEKRSIYREDIVKITPKPILHDDIKYKPSTPIPILSVEETNEVELPVQNSFEVDDQEGKNLQEQLLEYEALKLNHPELQRTPIDSDLYSALPNDHGSLDQNIQPEKSAYSLGQFVSQPIYHQQQQVEPAEIIYTTTTTTTATPATKNQYKTDFGSYQNAPKPTEPTITTTTEVYQANENANYNVIKPVKEQSPPQLSYEEESYQPLPQQSYETYQSPSQEPYVTYVNQDSYESPPQVYQVYEAPKEPQYGVFKETTTTTTTAKPVVFQDSDDQLAAPVNSYEVYEQPPPVPVHHHHHVTDVKFQDHVEQQSYVLPEPPQKHHVTSVYHQETEPINVVYKAQPPQHIPKKPPNHHLAANTPHPLVFGFKPIGTFLEDVFKPSRFPKNPLGNFLSQIPPPPRPPAPKKPPPPNFRQPKFFHRQPYQQSNKAVHRFPLGFFY